MMRSHFPTGSRASVLSAAGLGIPQMAYHAVLGGPLDWPGFDMTADLFRSMLPLLEHTGLPRRGTSTWIRWPIATVR